VYVAPFDNEEALRYRIVDACQTILIVHVITIHFIPFPGSKDSRIDSSMWHMPYKYKSICTVQLKLLRKKTQENTVVKHAAIQKYIHVYTSILSTYIFKQTLNV
jgi:hypothetical protein